MPGPTNQIPTRSVMPAYSGPGPGLARASQKTTLGHTPHTQQLGQQVGWQPPAAMDATGLRATSSASAGWALRARAPAASLRTSHVPRATARQAAAHLAGSGAA
eukprot:scaffold20657_cov57-Phaeocystis_antarctica.AAC.1